MMGSIKSMAGSAAATSDNFAVVTAALCSSVVVFPSLVSPLMKLFRVFKMLSRLRLINIYFGVYLEMFLSVCNLLFSLGGDEMTREVWEAAPDTRGKLFTYKVTPISVHPIALKVSLLIILMAIRIYRAKIRTYARKTASLSMTDSLLNRVAESARVTMIASLSLDVLFYSCHALVHLKWSEGGLSESARHSIWLSLLSVFIIAGDCISLLLENADCHFSVLKSEFRWQRKVQAHLDKEKNKTEVIGDGVADKESSILPCKIL
jgi:hypothetical protein